MKYSFLSSQNVFLFHNKSIKMSIYFEFQKNLQVAKFKLLQNIEKIFSLTDTHLDENTMRLHTYSFVFLFFLFYSSSNLQLLKMPTIKAVQIVGILMMTRICQKRASTRTCLFMEFIQLIKM